MYLFQAVQHSAYLVWCGLLALTIISSPPPETSSEVDVPDTVVKVTLEVRIMQKQDRKKKESPPVMLGPLLFRPGRSIDDLSWSAFVEALSEECGLDDTILDRKMSKTGAWRWESGRAGDRNPLKNATGWESLLDELRPRFDKNVRVYVEGSVSKPYQ
jgi:hypothetical protein